MNRKNLKICIVVPAYNEEQVIRRVLVRLVSELKKSKHIFKVVVVDDGSRDETASEAKKAGVHVIRHILNSGSGGASATGLAYARQNDFDMAATIDADGQHDPEDLVNGIEYSIKSGADLLIGSRLINTAGMTRTKILGNKGLSFITNMFFRVRVTDSQSGLRVFSKEALNKLNWRTNGYEYCSEMIWRAKQQDLVIKEYPIKAIYTSYSMGKGQNNWNAFNIVKSLIKIRVREFFGE